MGLSLYCGTDYFCWNNLWFPYKMVLLIIIIISRAYLAYIIWLATYINRNRTYWYGLNHNISLLILIIRVWTLQDQVEYIIHEFQHRFSNHGSIGIIASILVSTHVFQTLKYWCDFFKSKRPLDLIT